MVTPTEIIFHQSPKVLDPIYQFKLITFQIYGKLVEI